MDRSALLAKLKGPLGTAEFRAWENLLVHTEASASGQCKGELSRRCKGWLRWGKVLAPLVPAGCLLKSCSRPGEQG